MAEKRQSRAKYALEVYLKKMEDSSVPVPSSSSGTQLLETAQTSSSDTQLLETAQTSSSDTQLLEITQTSSSDTQLLETAQTSSSADDTAQSPADVQETQHPTGGACYVARSVVDLSPLFIPEEKLSLPELSESPMVQMPASPTAKTPEDSAKRLSDLTVVLSIDEKRQSRAKYALEVYVKKMEDSSVPGPSSSSDTQLLETAQTSSSADDTAQSPADVKEEEFVPTQHPTGGARYAARSVMDLSPLFIREEKLSLPELRESPMVQMPASPTAKTPHDSAKRKPRLRGCSECGPNLSSPSSVCSHITRVSRELEFGSHTEPTQITRDPRNPVFGVRLEDLADGGQDVPRVVVRCVAIIEEWCKNNKWQCLSIYKAPESDEKASESSDEKASESSDEMKAIKTAFDQGNDGALGDIHYNIRSYADVLKRYLVELPDPVIPEDMHDLFVDFVMSGRVECREYRTLTDLVHAMPPCHRSTLQALLRHFTKLLRWQAESNPKETYMQLIREVSHVLIRPPWREIERIRVFIKVYNDMLIELIRADCWGEVPPDLPAAMPFKPPVPPPRTDKMGFTAQLPADRLRDAPWYWGKLTSEQATAIVMPHPIGSFLVRDSCQPDLYALVLKIPIGVIGVGIMCKDDAYGFAEPLEYPSLVTLIHYHRSHYMTVYNTILETKLLYPIMVSMMNRGTPSSIDEQVKVLFMITQLYRKRRAMYFFLKNWDSWMESDLALTKQAIKAYKHLLKVLKEQSHQGNKPSVDEVDRSALCKQIQERVTTMEAAVEKQFMQAYLHNGEMATVKHEIKQLQRELYEGMDLLKEQGCTEDYVDKLANLDESLWLVDCQLPEAESLLVNTQPGTFLIRPKPEDNSHVISVKLRGKVDHCMIYHKNNAYGLKQDNLRFISLKELVDYHHYRSLDDRSHCWDICLLFPVNGLNIAQSESERNQQPQAEQPEELFTLEL